MAQIDASRFLANFASLFAPDIQDGQIFIAYIDEDNSFTVQADNVLHVSSSSSPSLDVDALSMRISALQSQADSIELICRDVPTLLTQIQTLSGSTDGLANPDFDYAFCLELIQEVRQDLETLKDTVEALQSEVRSTVVSTSSYDIS